MNARIRVPEAVHKSYSANILTISINENNITDCIAFPNIYVAFCKVIGHYGRSDWSMVKYLMLKQYDNNS